MDMAHTVLKAVDHNRYLAGGLVLLVVAMAWLYGCTATTGSLTKPGETVDRAGLKAEVVAEKARLDAARVAWRAAGAGLETALADQVAMHAAAGEALEIEAAAVGDLATLAVEDLNAQDAKQAAAFEVLGGLVPQIVAGTVNPASAVGAGIGLVGLILGISSTLDNRKKDGEIKARDDTITKLNGGAPPSIPT